MSIRTVFAVESWDKVYAAFEQINFASFDYDTVKDSLINYMKLYYPENFNDFIESSELIAVLELFAYIAELMAYRIDVVSHENFITTAQRKQSILKLAKLVSYRASRNIPGRGLVKINSVKTTEPVYDSLGNNLSNIIINWNDSNNANWKEQFFLVMNSLMTTKFGNPLQYKEVNGVNMQIYTLRNSLDSFVNGVKKYTINFGGNSLPFELVPSDLDDNGPFERNPDLLSSFSLIYSSDNRGDSSEFTGFLMFTKQGTLDRVDYECKQKVSNRQIELLQPNVNDIDIWLYRVDGNNIIENWKRVDSLQDQNLYFNSLTTRKKFEVETKENDQITLIFGDDNFSDSPLGNFQIWYRYSSNSEYSLPKSAVLKESLSFSYANKNNSSYSAEMTFELTSAIQNSAKSESTEHIRQVAPAMYYSQNRMVNGEDYNTFMLKDPSILKLKTVNRTFAGHSKFIDFNDASGAYQNIKIFGDDLTLTQSNNIEMIEIRDNARVIIDNVVEPILQSTDMMTALININLLADDAYGIISSPRRKFIEDNRKIFKNLDGQFVHPYGLSISSVPMVTPDGSLNEKSAIQGMLDRHWYGEPDEIVTINGIKHGKIKDPFLYPKISGKYYAETLPRTINGSETFPSADTGPGLQEVSSSQFFGLKFNRFLKGIGTGSISLFKIGGVQLFNGTTQLPEANGLYSYRNKVEVLTVEKTSASNIFTVYSNLRGKLPDFNTSLNKKWSVQHPDSTLPIDFLITDTTVSPFEQGDAFIIDINYTTIQKWTARLRQFGTNVKSVCVNLNGWWEIIHSDILVSPTGGNIDKAAGPNLYHQINLNPNSDPYSWVFLLSRQSAANQSESWKIYYRNISIIANSNNTKFWINNQNQITDSVTKKPVKDKIRILKSNLDASDRPLITAQQYDVVGPVYDSNANIDYSKLKVIPSFVLDLTDEKFAPQNVNQFYDFSSDSFDYYLVNDSSQPTLNRLLLCNEIAFTSGYDMEAYSANFGYDSGSLVVSSIGTFNFEIGSNISTNAIGGLKVSRFRRMPSLLAKDANGNVSCNLTTGLDFMWQHFSPNANLIDPSPSNIHDTFILTSGYMNGINQYLQGIVSVPPIEPSPLDLKLSYGYLLDHKMLSDTVVFHPGKIKLIFGSKADQKLRAKFKIVKAQSASFADERIKLETLSVIETFFNINSWDFGRKFYATELISLIHQKLSAQIASVVLVPVYSLNSFGSLFVIEPDQDEILQSCATVDEIEIVSELTPEIIRQKS